MRSKIASRISGNTTPETRQKVQRMVVKHLNRGKTSHKLPKSSLHREALVIILSGLSLLGLILLALSYYLS